MNLERILLGAIGGILIVSFLNPIITTFGFNRITYLMLLYSLPLTGMFSIIFVDVFSKRFVEESKREKIRELSKTGGNEIENLVGKWVIVHTKLGSIHKGRVRSYEGDMLILDYAARLDVPEGVVLDHLFLSKDEIKRIEVANNGEFTSKIDLSST